MASKYELDQMLQKVIETNSKLSNHVEALWDEIGQKQSRIADLNWELEETRAKHKETLLKFEEYVKKNMKNKKEVTKAQFQKHWLETFEQQRTDN
jgi:predicted  nucleic acid-binding Zn-ribbon protein